MKPTRSAALAVALASTLGAFGCHVYAEPEPVTVTAASVPTNIEASPYVYYEGRPVYLYDERWYYRDGNRWQYYRHPPPGLVRQRPYVQQAPPSQRTYPGSHGTPGYPGYRTPGVAQPPASAPPATRVQ